MLFSPLLAFLPWCWFVNMSLNMLIPVGRWYPPLVAYDRPLDLGANFFDGRRLFGSARTWYGLVLVLIFGAVGALCAPGHLLFPLAILVWAGDVLGSFVKRRLALPQGNFLPCIDHVDYIYTCGGTLLILGLITLPTFASAWLLTLLLTPAITRLAYALSLRDAKL